jgi:hypothetical protein
MVATVPFNYTTTTNFPGTFNVTASGYVVGVALPDPAVRYQLAGGIVSNNETVPMMGGLAISELTLPNVSLSPQPNSDQGPIIQRATNVTAATALTVTGFTVFDQAYGMIETATGPVPLIGSGGQIMYYRLGSNIRIPVAASSALVGGNVITNPVSWDFAGQQLVPFVAAFNSATAASGTYNSTTGIIALTFSPAPLGAGIGSTANGFFLSLSGLTASGGAGAGNIAQLAGDFAITGTATSGTVISLQGPIGLGAITLNSAVGTIAAGGGALPVKVLEISANNNMVPTLNSSGNWVWNYNGVAAVILI